MKGWKPPLKGHKPWLNPFEAIIVVNYEKTEHQDDLQMTNAIQKGIVKEFLK